MANKAQDYNELKRIFIRASTVASIINTSIGETKTCEITMLNNDKHLVQGSAFESYEKIDSMENDFGPNPLVGFDAV